MQEEIWIVQNSFWGKYVGTSGGDVRLCSIFKRYNQSIINIITSTSGLTFCKGQGLLIEPDKCSISPCLFDSFPFIVSYILRTIWGTFVLLSKSKINIKYVYSVSDFFPDVLPVFIRTFFRQTKWVQIIHHIYSAPNLRKGNILRNYAAYYLQKFSFEMIAAKAGTVFVVNNEVKFNLIKLGFDANKIFLTSNGLDFNFNEYSSPSVKKYDAIYVGRITNSKGIFDLIDIWYKVSSVIDAKLIIIGGGEPTDVEKLLILISKKNLAKSIEYLGYVDDVLKKEYLQSSKLFCFPSYEEGWGISIAEAMSMGLPVIAWNLKIYDEIFEDNILKIENNQMTGFSNKIIYMLKNNSEIENIGYASKEYIKKYDWDKIAKEDFKIIFDKK